MKRNITENPIYRCMNIFSNIVIASILWLFTSLPLVTIPASSVALYYTTVKVIRRSTGTIAKEYFHAFRLNIKQAMIPGIILLGYAIVMIADCYNFFKDKAYYTISVTGWILVLLLIIVLMAYLLPVMSRFTNTFLALLRMSIVMAIRHKKQTLLLLLLNVGGIVVTWRFMSIAVLVPGFVAYLSSFLMEPILKEYMPKVEEGSKEAELWYNTR